MKTGAVLAVAVLSLPLGTLPSQAKVAHQSPPFSSLAVPATRFSKSPAEVAAQVAYDFGVKVVTRGKAMRSLTRVSGGPTRIKINKAASKGKLVVVAGPKRVRLKLGKQRCLAEPRTKRARRYTCTFSRATATMKRLRFRGKTVAVLRLRVAPIPSGETDPDRPRYPGDGGVFTKFSCEQMSDYFTVNIPEFVSVPEGLGDNDAFDTRVLIKDIVVPRNPNGPEVSINVDAGRGVEASTVYPVGVDETKFEIYTHSTYTYYGAAIRVPLFFVADSGRDVTGYDYPDPRNSLRGAWDFRASYFNGPAVLRLGFDIDVEDVGFCFKKAHIPMYITPVKSELKLGGSLGTTWNTEKGYPIDKKMYIPYRTPGQLTSIDFTDRDYMVDPDASAAINRPWDKIYADYVVYTSVSGGRLVRRDDDFNWVPVPIGTLWPIHSDRLWFKPDTPQGDVYADLHFQTADGRVSQTVTAIFKYAGPGSTWDPPWE